MLRVEQQQAGRMDVEQPASIIINVTIFRHTPAPVHIGLHTPHRTRADGRQGVKETRRRHSVDHGLC
jgi:hypothetical protein